MTMHRYFALMSLTLLFSASGCLGRHRTDTKRSELNSEGLQIIDVNLISTQDAVNYFQAISQQAAYSDSKASLAKAPASELSSAVKSGVRATRFVAPNKTVDMSQNALEVSARNAASIPARTPSASVEEFLKAQSIDLRGLKPADMAGAYMALRALVSGDVEPETAAAVQTLNLTGPGQQIRDLTRLADLGKKTWDNLLTGVPAALDPSTWQLIDRNRRILSVAVELVDRVGPKDFKTKSYNKMLRHMIKASEIITGPTPPESGTSPEIPDWDP